MDRRFARITLKTAVVCALTIAAALPGAHTGLTLCICHDGHFSLETDCAPARCCPIDECSATETAPIGAFDAQSTSGEHPCIDIALLPGSVRGVTERFVPEQTRTNVVPVPSTAADWFQIVPVRTDADSIPPPKSLFDDTTPHHASVVLIV
jgi:hypothetical protein